MIRGYRKYYLHNETLGDAKIHFNYEGETEMNKQEIKTEIKRLQEALVKIEKEEAKKKWPITTKFYLYSNNDNNSALGFSLGLSDNAIEQFKYCGYEIEFTLFVNEDGTSYATHVDGIQLVTPLKMN